MKSQILLLLSTLAFFAAGCASSSAPNSTFYFTNYDANADGNVSNIYSLTSTSTSAWTGNNILWLDSTRKIDSLSDFAGKPIFLSFWESSSSETDAEEFSLDSVQSQLGDSVGIVTVVENSSLIAAYSFAQAQKITVPIVVDSADLAQLQYLSAVNGSVGYPQTFVLSPNGTFFTWLEGDASAHMLDSIARVAYK